MIRSHLFILLFFSFMSASAQKLMITYHAEDKKLTQIITEVEKEYDLYFSYAVDELKNKKATVHAENVEVSEFLQQLFHPRQLQFEIIENDFIAITHESSAAVRMHILDKENGEGLSFAAASIKGAYAGYIADSDGRLAMVISNPSETVLEISFLGYKTIEINVDSLSSQAIAMVYLEREVAVLEEVVVKEYLNKGITIDNDAQVSVDIQNMEILPGLSERDILLSTQVMAGIGSADESASGFNVRGSSRDNTFIYWNDIPVYQAAHYFGNISSFIPSAIGTVDIYKNHVPVDYGGASSGLVLIHSREELKDRPAVESNMNLTHADLYTNIPFAGGKGNLLFAGRRSYNDALSTPTFDALSDKLFEGSITEAVQQDITEDFDYNSQLIFSDINLVMHLEPTERNAFSLSLLRSQSKLDYNSMDDENTAQSRQLHNVTSLGGNFSWTRQWSDLISTRVSSSYTDYHMDYSLNILRDEEDGTQDDLEARVNNLTNWESRLTLDYVPVRNHVWSSGYQFNNVRTDLQVNEQFFFEEDFSETIETDGRTHGFFTDYSAKFRSGWKLGGGLRLNVYEALDETRWDAQFRANYEISPSFTLKSATGVYHQYISSLKEVDFVFSNTIEQNWITADQDEDIPVLKNKQLVIGALYTDKGWLIDLDLYAKQVDAPVARNFGPQIGEDGVISGQETILGLDLMFRKRWKHYRAWVSYAFQDSNVEVQADEAIGLEAQQFISGLNIRHQLQFSQTLSYRRFEFSSGYTVKSGLPYTNANDFRLIEEEAEDPFFDITYEALNSRRLPAYHRVDLSVWYKLGKRSEKGFKGEIGFSILNVLNRRNLYSRTFSIDENENDQTILLRTDRRLIGITPNVSLKCRF